MPTTANVCVYIQVNTLYSRSHPCIGRHLCCCISPTFPTCRNELQRLNSPNSAARVNYQVDCSSLLEEKPGSGHLAVSRSWHKACEVRCYHQPIDQRSSTYWTSHSSVICIPFMFLNLFRKASVRG